jgi:hypothetical protein
MTRKNVGTQQPPPDRTPSLRRERKPAATPGTVEIDAGRLARLVRLEKIVHDAVTTEGDDICWRDFCDEAARLVGVTYVPRMMDSVERNLMNCAAFICSLRTKGKYVPLATVAPRPLDPAHYDNTTFEARHRLANNIAGAVNDQWDRLAQVPPSCRGGELYNLACVVAEIKPDPSMPQQHDDVP